MHHCVLSLVCWWTMRFGILFMWVVQDASQSNSRLRSLHLWFMRMQSITISYLPPSKQGGKWKCFFKAEINNKRGGRCTIRMILCLVEQDETSLLVAPKQIMKVNYNPKYSSNYRTCSAVRNMCSKIVTE